LHCFQKELANCAVEMGCALAMVTGSLAACCGGGITLSFRSHPMLPSDPEKIEAAHPTLESSNQVKKGRGWRRRRCK
jgi:hypothetical protein